MSARPTLTQTPAATRNSTVDEVADDAPAVKHPSAVLLGRSCRQPAGVPKSRFIRRWYAGISCQQPATMLREVDGLDRSHSVQESKASTGMLPSRTV